MCDFYTSSFFYFYKKKTDTRTFTKVVIKVTDIQSHTKVCVLRLYTCINREGSVNSSSTIRHCPSHLDFFFFLGGGMLLLLQSASQDNIFVVINIMMVNVCSDLISKAALQNKIKSIC